MGIKVIAKDPKTSKEGHMHHERWRLQMEGLSPTPKLFDELMRGFTLTGAESHEVPSMNSRGGRAW
jgi:hypothetical protein